MGIYAQSNVTLTSAGSNLLANVGTNATYVGLQITRAEAGTGFTYPSGSTIAYSTALTGVFTDSSGNSLLKIVSASFTGNVGTISTQISNKDYTGNTTALISALGIYARGMYLTDNGSGGYTRNYGAEVLYAVAKSEDGCADAFTSLASYSIPILYRYNLNLTIAANNTATVELTDAGVAMLEDLHELADFVGYSGYQNSPSDDDVYGIEVSYPECSLTNPNIVYDSDKTYYKWIGCLAGKADNEVDFNNFKPWKRKRCLLNDKGEVVAYWKEGDAEQNAFFAACSYGTIVSSFTYNGTTNTLADGTTYNTFSNYVEDAFKTNGSLTAGTFVQVMVEQPKFYYKMVPVNLQSSKDDDSGITKGEAVLKARYYITPYPRDGFTCHPAFTPNGKELNYIYLPAYLGSCYDVYNSGTSSSGINPEVQCGIVIYTCGVNTNLSRIKHSSRRNTTNNSSLHDAFVRDGRKVTITFDFRYVDLQGGHLLTVYVVKDSLTDASTDNFTTKQIIAELHNAISTTSSISTGWSVSAVLDGNEELLVGNAAGTGRHISSLVASINETQDSYNVKDNYYQTMDKFDITMNIPSRFSHFGVSAYIETTTFTGSILSSRHDEYADTISFNNLPNDYGNAYVAQDGVIKTTPLLCSAKTVTEGAIPTYLTHSWEYTSMTAPAETTIYTWKVKSSGSAIAGLTGTEVSVPAGVEPYQKIIESVVSVSNSYSSGTIYESYIDSGKALHIGLKPAGTQYPLALTLNITYGGTGSVDLLSNVSNIATSTSHYSKTTFSAVLGSTVQASYDIFIDNAFIATTSVITDTTLSSFITAFEAALTSVVAPVTTSSLKTWTIELDDITIAVTQEASANNTAYYIAISGEGGGASGIRSGLSIAAKDSTGTYIDSREKAINSEITYKAISSGSEIDGGTGRGGFIKRGAPSTLTGAKGISAVLAATSSKLCSIAGCKPASCISQNDFETMAHNRGISENWTIETYDAFNATEWLILIESKGFSNYVFDGYINTTTGADYTQAKSAFGIDIEHYRIINNIPETGTTLSLGNSTGVGNYTLAYKEDYKDIVIPSYRGQEGLYGLRTYYLAGKQLSITGVTGTDEAPVRTSAEARLISGVDTLSFMPTCRNSGFNYLIGWDKQYDYMFIPIDTSYTGATNWRIPALSGVSSAYSNGTKTIVQMFNTLNSLSFNVTEYGFGYASGAALMYIPNE